MLSNHCMITFWIDKIPVKLEPKLIRDIRTANWHRFRSLLKDSLCFIKLINAYIKALLRI